MTSQESAGSAREGVGGIVPSRGPLVEMLAIALPSVATMTSYTVMQFVDAKMVAHIQPASPAYIAAQGNGGIAAWTALSLMFGTLMIVNTFVSQNLGAGRPERGAAYGWSTIWLSLAWGIVLVPFGIMLPTIFSSMGHPDDVTRMESAYGQILVFGGVFMCGARGISNYFYGIHKAGVVMLAAFTANFVNMAMNIPLIFGSAGMAATGFAPIDLVAGMSQRACAAIGFDGLGVAGAAWATVIGSAVEVSIPFVFFLSPGIHRRFRTRDAWKPDVGVVRDVVRVGWPGGVMMLNEIVCWAYLFSTLIPHAGRVGVAHAQGLAMDAPAVESAGRVANAASWVALRYMHLSFMPAVGLSIAVTALVGKCMGMRRADLAAKRAWLGLWLCVGYMGVMALIFVVAREPLIAFFIPKGLSEQERADYLAVGGAFLIAAAVFQLFDAVAINLSGALRGAGDTVWPGVVTIVLSWTCIVGLGTLLVEVRPQWGAIGPWVAASLYIVLLGCAMFARFLFGPWRKIELVEAGARVEQSAE